MPNAAVLVAVLLLAGGGGAIATSAAHAQEVGRAAPETEVLDVVDRFMHAISTNDVAALASLIVEGAMTTVERPDGAGGTRLTRRPFDPERFRTGAFRERYWDPVVHVRGGLAVVWAPYEFWRDGTTTHCGIDVVELVRQDGRWRIGGLMWTVEPDACAALRPSDPARVRPAR